MTTLTLYELVDQFKEVAERLADMDLPTEVVADTLESISGPLEEKAANVAAFCRNLEATAAQIKEAEDRMSARRRALERRADWLREYLLENMTRCGISKIETPYFQIAVRTNPHAVQIDDERQLPSEFLQIVPERQVPDRAAIKYAIKSGRDVPGARITQTQRVDIK